MTTVFYSVARAFWIKGSKVMFVVERPPLKGQNAESHCVAVFLSTGLGVRTGGELFLSPTVPTRNLSVTMKTPRS